MVILAAYEVVRPTDKIKKYKIKRQKNILASNVEEAKLYCNDQMQWDCIVYEKGNTEILLNSYNTDYDKTFKFAHIFSIPEKFTPFKLEVELKQELLTDIDEKIKLCYNEKFEYKFIDLEIRYHIDLPKNYKIVNSGKITNKTLVIDEYNAQKGFYYWERAIDKYYFQTIQTSEIKNYTIEEALKKLRHYRFANPI